jgi:endonuclease-3 related protein
MDSPEVETPAIPDKSSVLQEIYHRLYQRYGPQYWWPGEGPLDVIIGAILTQSAAWPNVEQALYNLKQADCWSLKAIHHCPQDQLAAIIRPCGYFNTKARKLKAFAKHIINHYGGHLEAFLAQDPGLLREELLSIYGIGPETADDILVYAAEQPSFVIDAYTVRILQRMGLSPTEKRWGYHSYQTLFHTGLPHDTTLFNEYHALLDQHAKKVCTRTPKCQGCCLQDICQTGQQR